jgi:hypothetical protein
MRRASQVRADIAEKRRELRLLRAELRDIYAETRDQVIRLRKGGMSLDGIAVALELNRCVVVNNLHSQRVRRPGKRLHDYSQEQQREYRKYRRNGISAEASRAFAGMDSGAGLPISPGRTGVAARRIASAPAVSDSLRPPERD